MAWGGKERDNGNKGNEVVANQINPKIWAIEDEAYPKVNNKNS
jgi:hypothetical protein